MMLLRQKAIRLARKDFWTFCKINSKADQNFFTEERWHLKLMTWVLQALYERRLTKAAFTKACSHICPDWFIETDGYKEMVSRLRDDYIYTRMIMNEPPRIGKSRTLVNFTKWLLGVNVENRVMTASYNDSMAQSFSRFTRDGIMDVKTYPYEIIYNDIFPHSVVSSGNSSYKQWALEGQFFSYKGVGVEGSATGSGANILIVDDPIKDAEEALNENRLETIWTWYTSTFLSRLETDKNTGKTPIQIVNMTRWASGDICGRILGDEKNKGSEADEWFVFKLEARYGDNMLCPSLLDVDRYESLKKNVLPEIFYANFHQQPIDLQGRLYRTLKTYKDIPRDENGKPLFERIIAYTDTADTGEDFLASIVGGVYNGELYVTDVLYTKEGMEVTETAGADMLIKNNVNYALIESNNGGRGYARAVERILWEKHRSRFCVVKWFHQSANKKARILTMSNFVQEHVYFPVNWADKWPDFYQAVTTYQKEGKNKHDDAADAITGICEMLQKKGFGLGVVTVNL
jgi:predicted phage terminase large subunit-like protein